MSHSYQYSKIMSHLDSYSNFYSKDKEPSVWVWIIAVLFDIVDIIAGYKLCLYAWNDYLAIKYSLPAIDWIVITVFLCLFKSLSGKHKTEKPEYYIGQSIAHLITYFIMALIVSYGIAGLG